MAPVFRARVIVNLRRSILDPQGRTVERSLHNLGHAGVSGVRVGKVVELLLDGPRERAEAEARRIAETVLANPVMETFELELDEAASSPAPGEPARASS